MASKKRIAAIIAAIIIVLLLLAAGITVTYLWTTSKKNDEITKLNKRLEALEKGKSKTATSEKKTEKPADPYEGWLTYTNSIMGYKLRYPPDWTYKEQTGTEMDMPSNYVSFYSQGDTYSVTFGMREPGSNVFITGRTGLGQGEPTESGAVTVLGNTYPKIYHLLDGKVKVIWFGDDGYWSVGGYEAYAELGSPGIDYMAVDLKGLPEESIAEKIVSSLKIN